MSESDHFAEICYSKDGGRNWSNWKRVSIGAQGEYADRIRCRFKRLGVSRQWVFKIRVSSPRRSDMLGAVANLEGYDA